MIKEMSIEENGLLDVAPHKPQGPAFIRSKIFIISFAAILGLVIVGITIGLSVALSSEDKDKIDRVQEGYSKLEGTDIYTFGKNDHVIVVLPDIHGASPEAMNITAHFAKAGFTSILIDYFNGNISNRPAASVALSYSVSIINNLHKRGYKSIQAQGYCYGGRVGTSLSSMNNVTLTSCAVAHPSSLVQSDADLIIKPMFFELASNDVTGIEKIIPYFNSTLKERGIRAEYKVYPNTGHGFAVNSTMNPEQKAICLEDSINWFLANK